MERLEDRYRPGFREYRIDPIVDRLKVFGYLAGAAFWGLAYLVFGSVAITAGIIALLLLLVAFGVSMLIVGIPAAFVLGVYPFLRIFSRQRAYDWINRWPLIGWLDRAADKMFSVAEKIIYRYLARLLTWPAERFWESLARLRRKR